MNNYTNTLTNTRGDSLPGYRVQVMNSLGSAVDIYSDKSGTRFRDANNAIINYAVANASGKVVFYYQAEDGLTLQVLDGNGSLVDATANFADNFIGSFTAQGAGAVPRTVNEKASETLSVLDFGATGDGMTNDTAALTLGFAAALSTGKRLHFPAGTYVLNDTPGVAQPIIGSLKAVDVSNKTLVIEGDGMGLTKIRRAAGSITANNQSLLRFCASAGGKVILRNVTLDMDSEVGNITPGGSLTNNFTWQHNLCAEFRPLDALNAFDLVHCENVEILNPISDGISLRGGLFTGPGFRKVNMINVRNDKWGVTTVRPRVRGDITITAVCDEINIVGGRFPRLHLERDIDLSVVHYSRITVSDALIGEFLSHNPGNLISGGGTPEEISVSVNGGRIEYQMFAGCGIVQLNGTQIVLRHSSSHRLTEGDFIFNNVRFVLGVGYSGPTTAESSLFVATSGVYPRRVAVIGGEYMVEPGATPPRVMFNLGDNAGGSGVFEVGGNFRHNVAGSLLLFGSNVTPLIREMSSTYDGSHPYGVGLIFVPQLTAGGARSAIIQGVVMLGAGAVFTPPFAGPTGTGGIMTITARGNVAQAGKLVDLTSATYGAGANTQHGTAWVYGRGSEIEASGTHDPASVANGAQATTTLTAKGAALGDFLARSSFSLSLGGLGLGGYVSAADTVTLAFTNLSGGAVDLGSGTLRAVVVKQ